MIEHLSKKNKIKKNYKLIVMNSCLVPKDNITTNNRILVIGDLHADYEKTINLFQHFKLIDINKKWIGKNTIIVQLGDQIDGYGRGNYKDAAGELKILDFFDNMHEQAKIYEGSVYSIIGNHELMNVMGNFSYASQKDIDDNGGIEKRKQLYAPGGNISKRLACTRNTIIKINDIIFVHAGIIPELIKKDKHKVITIVNKLMRSYFRGEIDDNHEDFKELLKDKKGVLWDRSLGKDNVDCNELDKMLKIIGANHIVIGHSPQNIINSKCNDKVWRVDVGLSKAIGDNKYQILEIVKKQNKNIFTPLF